MQGLPGLQVIRPTAFPAVLMLALWPLFMLLPARASRGFFIVSGIGLVTLLGGPLLAGAIVAVVLLGYALTEAVARQQHNRRAKFILGLLGLHAAYWASFMLTPPAAFTTLREADRVPVFILFSGVGVTFFRLVSYYYDRMRGTVERVALIDYLAHMCFFPQLRHGPIERCREFSRKIAGARQNWQPTDAGIGLARVGVGFGLLLGFANLMA
ncbi:MAG: hypothetical protein JXO22_11785, partial [Phycisphaerae bacterium]|nr:hypothetical protein [Phycisphaerae bacterium]